jgi:O-antigen/teichoic acid export membrane protein
MPGSQSNRKCQTGKLEVGLAKNSLRTFISQVTAQVLQFVLGVMTARLLGPEGKGLIHLLIVWLAISTALGSLGLGQASIYFIGKDRKCLLITFGSLLIATAVMSVLLGTAGWLFLRYGPSDIYYGFPHWIWAMVALLIPVHLLQSFLMQVLSAILRISEINIVEVARVAVQFLLFVSLVFIMGMGLYGAFLAYAFAAVFGTAAFFLIVVYHGGCPKRPDWRLLVALLRYGVKAYLSSLLGLLSLRLDAMLVASLAVAGIHAAGIYSVATNLAELLLFIPVSIRLTLFPMIATSSAAEANRLTPAACRHTLLLTCILALLLGTVGRYAIQHIYGNAFTEAVTPLLILLPGVVLLSQAIILYGDLNGRGKPEATLASTLLSLVTTVTLDCLLIPKYGITGAALASSVAYMMEFVVAASFFVYYSQLSWKELIAFKRNDLAYYLQILPERRTIKVSS